MCVSPCFHHAMSDEAAPRRPVASYALHDAAATGNIILLKELLDALAAEEGDEYVPEYDSEGDDECAGRTLNSTDADSCTPLQLALLGGYYDCAKLCVAQGAELGCVSGSPCGHLAVAGFVCRPAAPLDDLADILRYLVEHGLSPDATDDQGRTLLHVIAWHGLLGLVDLVVALMKEGTPEVNLNAVDLKGQSALHYAAAGRRVECVGALLALGLFADLKDSGGNTPAHAAAYNGALECMHVLLGAASVASPLNAWEATPGAIAAAAFPPSPSVPPTALFTHPTSLEHRTYGGTRRDRRPPENDCRLRVLLPEHGGVLASLSPPLVVVSDAPQAKVGDHPACCGASCVPV